MPERDDDRPAFAALIDWLEGRLDAERTAAVAAAVEAGGDPRVAATISWLSGFLATAAAVPQYEPPPIIRQRLRQRFAAWDRARAALQHPPVELEAALLFDSRQDLVLAGVRAGEDADDAVHLAWTTPVADLVLDVVRTGQGALHCEGQVLATDATLAPVFEVRAEGPGVTVRTVDGDRQGRFMLADVPDTVTTLRALNGELTMVAAVDLRTVP